jgi:hypothetical protein
MYEYRERIVSRVDKPELRCDRCKITTLDTAEMGKFARLSHSNMGGTIDWDLCPECWSDFTLEFMGNEAVTVRKRGNASS